MGAEEAGHLGHRERLRQRFLANPSSLLDYELIELLLTLGQPRRDMKPVAKALIGRFGSFAAVVSAEPEALKSVDYVGEVAVTAFKAVREAALRLAREQVLNRPVLSSWSALIDYCRASMAHETSEQVRLLFLDVRNQLVADEVQQRGTVDHTPVYPREVVKRALALSASAVIMVHNHPSGDPSPSQADIAMTRQIRDALAGIGIALHDHVIIARGGHASFKSMGLL